MRDKVLNNLECLASAGIGSGSIWNLQTTLPLKRVLEASYFDRFANHGVRRGDRISVLASYDEDEIESAWVLVTHVTVGKSVEVKKL